MSIIQLVILMILVSYIVLYTRPKTYTEILQTNIEDIRPDILLEKQPTLIFDKIVNIDDILKTTFNYMFTFSKKQYILTNTMYQNNSKYVLFHNNSENDIEIDISKSRVKQNHFNVFNTVLNEEPSDTNSIKIIMKPFNVLILPYLFNFKSLSEDIDVRFLTDFFHIITI